MNSLDVDKDNKIDKSNEPENDQIQSKIYS